MARAIVWVSGGVEEGVTNKPTPSIVVCMSLTGEAECPSRLQEAENEALQRGALPVAAAGDNGINRLLPLSRTKLLEKL